MFPEKKVNNNTYVPQEKVNKVTFKKAKDGEDSDPYPESDFDSEKESKKKKGKKKGPIIK